MTHAQFDINEVIDKMLNEHEKMAAMAPAQQAAFRYLVLRKNAVLLPPGHVIAHREREMVPSDIYDDLAKDLERTRAALNQTSDTAEAMCLERNVLQERNTKLVDTLRKFFDFVEKAPVGSGVCCCGDSMTGAHHGDHGSVDQWDHSVSLWGREIEALLAPKAPEAIAPEITDVSQLGADAKCPVCYDVGHIIVCDTSARYVTAPCPSCGDTFRDMATAPRDGTMVLLKVRFTENSTEDGDLAVTIGANNLDHDEIDEWKFAGWCWTHDHFTDGKGTPLGWLPLVAP